MMALALVAMLVGAGLGSADARYSYTFKVHNNTQHRIVSLVASESGEEAGEFDIGNGIGPGQTATLQWDKSTDNSHCEWAFSAVYDDGTFSEPVMINFCEDDLELVFDE
jgi:hypothetical protein